MENSLLTHHEGPSLTLSLVAQALYGTPQSHIYPDKPVTVITTDSKRVVPGALFVAIKGERFDGHSFISDAADRGALAVLCQEDYDTSAHPSLYFFKAHGTDTTAAFRQIAAHWRAQFSATPIICIAGAVGKTTTKEFLAALLRGKWTDVLRTQGSQNGFLGIAITLSELRAHHGAAVIEVGIDDIGTMAQHMNVLRPTHAVVTAIGAEHLERLIDLDTVAKEETQSLIATASTGGMIYVDLDEPAISSRVVSVPEEQVTGYSLSTADLPPAHSKNLVGHYNPNTSLLTVSGLGLDEFTVEVPLSGAHNAKNLLAALTIARSLGLLPEELRQGLATFKGAPGRSELKTIHNGAVTVLCDYYNANPESVRAALKNLIQLKSKHASKRTIAVLGDMLELGVNELTLHKDLSKDILDARLHAVLLLGKRMHSLYTQLQTLSISSGKPNVVQHYSSSAELTAALSKLIQPGDLVLIKGSRSMKMELVFEELTKS